MRDLMPETRLMEEEDSRKNTLSFPRKRAAPVSHRYSSVASVFCGYGGGTVEGISDYGAGVYVVSGNHRQVYKGFHGLAWTKHDRAYRRQVAQTKDL